ncbi:MAG: circularly permuted type 2 ATP-grasp protein [Verrucomicrobia bacterium]|nr:circularly permuted type 2 ATP-grasp protein [Verrucomicrobiota bacterium]
MEASLASRTTDLTAPGVLGGLANYRPLDGVYDEMVDASGEVRPHWRLFHEIMNNCGAAALRSRQETIGRLLQDHGATYNVYQDAKGASRAWALDALPLIIAADEWRKVAAALSQRARLLNLILTDLSGPQRLLAEGWIPPALVFANSGYLRAAHGGSLTESRLLAIMGTDLVRGANGAWMVLADRTQAPSGMGYSLENRLVMSSVMPEEFGACGVQRLASFFDFERDALRTFAPSRRGMASVVLLTPGPWNETYFEHAFKARYLGFPLVEGADLTV